VSPPPLNSRSEDAVGTARVVRASRAVAFAAVLLAGVYLAWRGIWRSGVESGDLAVGYSAARAWLGGQNPYDAGILAGELARAGGDPGTVSNLSDQLRNVYFPTTLPVFVPLALLGWPEARLLGLGLNVAATLFIAFGVVRLAGWSMTSTKGLALTAFVLALAPIHTTIAFGQTGILATAALVAAMLAEREKRPRFAGLLYGVAAVIKIQIGLPFLFYLIWRRRWAMPATATLVIVASTLVSVVAMQAAATSWSSTWLANLGWLSRPGGINDPGPLNPDRFSLLDLRYPLRTIIDNGIAVDLLTVGVIGVAALVYIWARQGRDARPDLLSLAFVAVLGLLVTYHRYYDAVLLAIPLAWAGSVLGTVRRREGLVILVLCADFLLPMQSILHDLQLTGTLPGSVTDGAIWTTILLSQHAWALVLMAFCMLLAATKERPVLGSASVAGST
jgi:Glycosyltransferase family 87